MKNQNARKFYKRWRFWVFFVVPSMFFLVAIVTVINMNKNDELEIDAEQDKSANSEIEMTLDKYSPSEIERRGNHANKIDSLLSELYEVFVFTEGESSDILIIQSDEMNADSLSQQIFDEYQTELGELGFRQVEIGSGAGVSIYKIMQTNDN